MASFLVHMKCQRWTHMMHARRSLFATQNLREFIVLFPPRVDGIMYGQGKQALGRALSAGPEQAAHMMQNFLDHFPSLKSFVKSAKEKARLHGCVQTLWGRTRPLPGPLRYIPLQNLVSPWSVVLASASAFFHMLQGSWAGIRSLDPELRAQAERQSVNTLIQGSAA